MPQVELTYAQRKPVRWYQHRWVYRLAVLLAAVWVGWTVVQAVPPFWYRYRCYRVLEQARQFPTTPEQILLDDSAPGPAVSHAATSVVQFQNELWAARRNAGLGTLTSTMLSCTPIFCHSLKTPKGSERVVQIYAQITGVPGSGQTLALLATSCDPMSRRWIFLTPKDPINLPFRSMGFAGIEFHFAASKSLTVSGGAVLPTDSSIAEIKLGVDGHTYPIRIHLGDNFGGTPGPQMALEGREVLMNMNMRICTGFSSMGFYDWPVAPAPGKN